MAEPKLLEDSDVAQIAALTLGDDAPRSSWANTAVRLARMLQAQAAHMADLQSILETIDKITGPIHERYANAELVERVVMLRKQVDLDRDRCRSWEAEVAEVRDENVRLRKELEAEERLRDRRFREADGWLLSARDE